MCVFKHRETKQLGLQFFMLIRMFSCIHQKMGQMLIICMTYELKRYTSLVDLAHSMEIRSEHLFSSRGNIHRRKRRK